MDRLSDKQFAIKLGAMAIDQDKTSLNFVKSGGM